MATQVVDYGAEEKIETEPSVFRPTSQPRITTGFNLALFAYLALTGFFNFVVVSGKAEGVPLAGIFLTTALDMVRFSVVLFVTACILKAFWQRLVSSLFAVRSLDYQEAIAIVLMVAILFSR